MGAFLKFLGFLFLIAVGPWIYFSFRIHKIHWMRRVTSNNELCSPESVMIVAANPRTDEVRGLIRELDAEISARYPGSPINGIDAVNFEKDGGYFVVARGAGQAVGCGAFRPADDRCAEIKRMFVRASARRRGIARKILRHLEVEIRRRGFQSIVLETGRDQPEALALYEAEGYFPIPAFLGYVGSPISRCYARKP